MGVNELNELQFTDTMQAINESLKEIADRLARIDQKLLSLVDLKERELL